MVSDDRLKRAKTAIREIEAGEMDVSRNEDGTFEVKDYEVGLDGPSCTCADHDYNERYCKHIVAVVLQSMWDNVSVADSKPRVTPKPSVLAPKLSEIPESLRSLDQWVCWKQKLHENKDGSKRWTKVPVDAVNKGFASSTDSDTWTDFRTAVGTYNVDSEIAGVGIVIQKSDGLIGIDIDDCRNSETGEIDEAVKALLSDIETYVEVSPSGTGLRIFVFGEVESEFGCEAELPGEAHIERYVTGRYLTVTGHRVDEYSTDDVRHDERIIREVDAIVRGAESTLDEYEGR